MNVELGRQQTCHGPHLRIYHAKYVLLSSYMWLDVNINVVSVTPSMKIEGPEKGIVPVQIIFCLKEKNQKKINSHRSSLVWKRSHVPNIHTGGSSMHSARYWNQMSVYCLTWGRCRVRPLFIISGKLLTSIPMSVARAERLLRSRAGMVSTC